ncbi:pyridoxine 5'-phosphate synthase [Dysgonomonas sp. HDW5A]|uniref:pyridoxine 5'-phosphate synthase n=1 Tax=Dysgonomonas sp. HDW5A TaxID=2714926 RepID=UPI00140ACA0C|nr:pyridoxine 5'-phosphate synthase [Dysgonomonas sp. HDW5A]QIK58868.1 pyridoxine 5'-phosphate synthase [Dysgonomonas sp. HDW5A]
MTQLSVNINKIATIRNARGGDVPNVLQVALDCERFGAQGITVHPRPDERHIKFKDVYDLKAQIKTEFNIEGYPSTDFIKLIKTVKPTQVTLVPDAPDAITSNAGWDTKVHQSLLSDLIDEFRAMGVRTSIFTGTDPEIIEYAAKTGTDRIELYTEPYATLYPKNKEEAIAPFIEAAKIAKKLGLGINAGHDLSLENLNFFYKNIPYIEEVSIGHALISDALYLGLERTIAAYKNCLK